ncbi:glycosyltransferase family 2 protein [Campylobacter sp. RM3125]|uniref:glycosyltransferase family 2 protein n=1 Tax=Campylobacter molothri TaxID=1032242 RepID=UPI00301C874B|nr:glycosyltransferase family 2 protein [Campylobacter sp. RM3125]MBZ7970908.1 glycosyltransferase family 2 protein [Campylobacter sp. RM3124]
MPKISIILPTYNVESYIERALQSCINQTFKDIEIIVVDDCGNDKSIEIAKEYAKKDNRVKIVYNEKNLGTFASRNIGVLNSNSPYIMFLDPDDYLELNACEAGFDLLKEDKDLIVFNYKTEIENVGLIDYSFRDKNLNLDLKQFLFFIVTHLNFTIFNPIFNKIYKKDLYLNSLKMYFKNYKRISMAEDVLANCLYLANTKNICLTNQALYCYAFNPCSITREKKDTQRIKNSVDDLIYVEKEIATFFQGLNKDYFYFFQLVICNLNIHKIDLIYKYLTKNFLKKLMLKIKRKMVKIKMKKYIKLAKNILKEKNVSSSL